MKMGMMRKLNCVLYKYIMLFCMIKNVSVYLNVIVVMYLCFVLNIWMMYVYVNYFIVIQFFVFFLCQELMFILMIYFVQVVYLINYI